MDFYLGGYGNFDAFANACCKKYQETHPQVKRIFVTPYITAAYQEKHLKPASEQYDATVYLPIENAPLKFAISHRNRKMVEQADWVVTYVSRSYGGAYQAYRHAKHLNKDIDNLAEKTKDECLI